MASLCVGWKKDGIVVHGMAHHSLIKKLMDSRTLDSVPEAWEKIQAEKGKLLQEGALCPSGYGLLFLDMDKKVVYSLQTYCDVNKILPTAIMVDISENTDDYFSSLNDLSHMFAQGWADYALMQSWGSSSIRKKQAGKGAPANFVEAKRMVADTLKRVHGKPEVFAFLKRRSDWSFVIKPADSGLSDMARLLFNDGILPESQLPLWDRWAKDIEYETPPSVAIAEMLSKKEGRVLKKETDCLKAPKNNKRRI